MLGIKTHGISFFVLAILCFVKGHNCDHKNEIRVSGPRIVGGEDVSPGELPFQVAVHWRKYDGQVFKHWCGGSIIDEEYVLTAGHCVFGISPTDLLVIAGVLKNTVDSSEETKVLRNVTEVLIHEEYVDEPVNNDIAILKVSPGFPTDKPAAVWPIKMRKEAAPDSIKCTVSGWGRLEANEETLPLNLQVAFVNLIPFEECRFRYKNYTEGSIQPGMICAHYKEKRADACTFDSGGPLQCGGFLTGIVSWGEGCALTNYPGVYTDVTYYKEWIERHLRKSKDEL